MLTSVRRTLTKAGQQMLIATIEDMSGDVEVVVFSKLYPQIQALFVQDEILIVKGRLRLRERPGTTPGEEPPIELSITVNEVTPFVRPAQPREPAGYHLTVQNREQIDRLALLMDEWPGAVPVVIHVGETAQRMPRALAAGYNVRAELERIFGPTGVREGAPTA